VRFPHHTLYVLRSKIENAQRAEKTTTTRSGNRETAITRTNANFRVMAVFKQPQRVVACEVMPRCESRVVAVEGNDHNDYRLHENTARCRVRFPFTGTTRCETIFSLPNFSYRHSRQLASDRATSWCFSQPCLLRVWRRFLMTKVKELN